MQTPAARREQLLDEFKRSGLSGKKFAALVGQIMLSFSGSLKVFVAVEACDMNEGLKANPLEY